ncbi:TetR/AcrR family transcriptional regulator [Rhodococcus sp. IEGM 1408]|uniref:TetR/AcrR family transcriptional regulator n=1 Tax=Rhodococcus sp. IEGM 1408 TaxID=3082220 RepID=UPI0029550B8E|nr:TetR/AcrR family transcriptional regulator [Rhodococcus sp. IEGM 1408]MDV8001093.1 TetR/AcrR family transcriptional regulator [Rhodococcus sp. IEGM 1408]
MRSRDAVLEATRNIIGEAGFHGVNIAAVAKRAGVSRQTVYSIFGTREELVSQAVSDRLTTLVSAFTDLLASVGSPLELLVETMVEARRRILDDPLLRVLALSGTGNPIFDPGAAERAHGYCVALLSPAIDRFPELSGRIDFLADISMHVGWSVLCLDDPASRSDAELRAFLTAWLAPMLRSLET